MKERMNEPIYVAFSTQKGGAGKTTLTVLTASYLHYVKGYNVAVVDCDFPQYSIKDMRERDMTSATGDDHYKAMAYEQFKRLADTISIEGKKNITLVSGKESMVFSSEKNIINGSATNIKLEAAKEYDLNTQTGTMKGTNLTVEGTANMTVTGGIVKINS